MKYQRFENWIIKEKETNRDVAVVDIRVALWPVSERRLNNHRCWSKRARAGGGAVRAKVNKALRTLAKSLAPEGGAEEMGGLLLLLLFLSFLFHFIFLFCTGVGLVLVLDFDRVFVRVCVLVYFFYVCVEYLSMWMFLFGYGMFWYYGRSGIYYAGKIINL